MRRKEQKSMLMLAIVMAFVVGVFWAGPVGAKLPFEAGDPCAGLQQAADVMGCEFGESECTDAPVEQTGQTTLYATGDDGDLQKGVAWPDPRFTDNEDGTVTDNLTGLIWLQNANCIQTHDVAHSGSEFDKDGFVGDGRVTWENALVFVAGMNDGTYAGYNAEKTDWRLPNVKELQSLIHYGVHNPALPNTAGTDKWSPGDPFSGVESNWYWSSTTLADNPTNAWYVSLYHGPVGYYGKDHPIYVWPVRGGE